VRRRCVTAIEDLYESYYTMVGAPYDDTEFSGRSDYRPVRAARSPPATVGTAPPAPTPGSDAT